MAKRINGMEVETEYVEWGVEHSLGVETFIVECEDEDEAVRAVAQLGGKVVARRVFETGWAEVLNAPDS